ncbi:MAG: electron transfer flavoprotein subunit alpha/FixB family protein [Chloroflexota bacterium]
MIFALIDHDLGTMNKISLEMLTAANALAQEVGASVAAVLIGEPARGVVDELKAYGVSQVHLIQHAGLDDYAAEAWGKSVVQLIEAQQPQAVVAPGTERGQEVMAHVAAFMDAPLAANCTAIQPNGSGYDVTRVLWGGSLLEESKLEGGTKLLTVAAHVFSGEEGEASADMSVEEFAATLEEKDFRTRIKSRIVPDTDKVSLTDARVVVGGGRGVGSTAGFESLEEVAHLVNGAVGCSRAVTSLGWRPHADQVGQTGERIAPDLYIACGISGAIQHMAGCKGSKNILVINTDHEAPILSKADYAIIGDLHDVLPAISDAIRAETGQ